jgi:FKBP-type peptidyl-prolyl cis-trans isomerase
VIDVTSDGSIQILVIEEGTGAPVDPEDTVFYKHETRFDNGQLVDLQETRKIPEKFPMKDDQFHDFLRLAFLQLKRGSVSFIKLTEPAHKMIYHKSSLSL